MAMKERRIEYFILFLLILFYLFYISINVPKLFNSDALYKWALAKQLCLSEVDVLFNYKFHHHLRWGSWFMPYILCKPFGTSPIVNYMSALVPSTLALFIFIKIIVDNLYPKIAIVFVLLWITSTEIVPLSYHILPTGQSLIWFALVIYFLSKLLSNNQESWKITIGLSLSIFILYGVKLPYTFILPGILFLCYLKKPSYCLKILGVLLGLYLFESLILWYVSDGDLIFGRLQALLFDGVHIKAMHADRINNQLAIFFDGGVLLRWFKTSGSDFFLYLFTLILAIYNIRNHDFTKLDFNKSKISTFLLMLSIIYISFFILTTFSIISIDHFKIGQPIRSRYLVFIQPICLILITYYCFEFTKTLKYNFLKVMLFIAFLVFIFPNINLIVKNKIKWQDNIPSLLQVNNYYKNFNNKTCFKYTRHKELFLIKIIYENWDNEGVQRLSVDTRTYKEKGQKVFYIPDRCADPFYYQLSKKLINIK